MNIADYMKQMKRVSKADDIPGTLDSILEDDCPACNKKLKKYKPCCGAKFGYIGCNCGYKILLNDNSM